MSELGPEMEKQLKKQGREGQKEVGFPLTLHFGRGLPVDKNTITCALTTDKGEKIDGFYMFSDGNVRTTSAPGVVTFWPFEPIKGKVEWQWSWGDGGRNHSTKGKFSAK